MSRSENSQKRIRLTHGLLGLSFLAAAGSQAGVQLFRSDEILKMAGDARRFNVSRTDVARRGSILAADGTVLAQSSDTYELGVNFRKTPESPGFLLDLASASGISAAELEVAAASKNRSMQWRRTFSSERAAAIRAAKTKWRADGVSLAKTTRRMAALGDSAAGFIGLYQGKSAVSGLELSQDDVLAGTNGERSGLPDRTGAFLPMRLSQENKSAVAGEDITLTILPSLQIAAAAAIKRAVESNKATSGVALVMDPKTGDLLAMANWPSVDPDNPQAGSTFNPCYMGVYEPGSTFKILTLAKALDAHKVDPSAVVNCSGALPVIKSRSIRCDLHNGHRAHGAVNSERAIAKSCNVSAATWALRIGHTDMVRFLDDLGLLKRSELGLPLEARGQFNRNEPAKKLQLATVGFGQSLSATPIGLIGAFGMLANGGVRVEPKLIARYGNVLAEQKPTQRLISQETSKEVMALMESVIDSDGGTGAKLRIPGYRLAGKTGTAEKIGSDAKGYVSSFVGFVPAVDTRAVILVMVDNPKAGKYYGASVAGPVFKELAQQVIRTYELKPTGAKLKAKP